MFNNSLFTADQFSSSLQKCISTQMGSNLQVVSQYVRVLLHNKRSLYTIVSWTADS